MTEAKAPPKISVTKEQRAALRQRLAQKNTQNIDDSKSPMIKAKMPDPPEPALPKLPDFSKEAVILSAFVIEYNG
jgi:hypothetical protein